MSSVLLYPPTARGVIIRSQKDGISVNSGSSTFPASLIIFKVQFGSLWFLKFDVLPALCQRRLAPAALGYGNVLSFDVSSVYVALHSPGTRPSAPKPVCLKNMLNRLRMPCFLPGRFARAFFQVPSSRRPRILAHQQSTKKYQGLSEQSGAIHLYTAAARCLVRSSGR